MKSRLEESVHDEQEDALRRSHDEATHCLAGFHTQATGFYKV